MGLVLSLLSFSILQYLRERRTLEHAPLYEKGTKQKKNRPMETTKKVKKHTWFTVFQVRDFISGTALPVVDKSGHVFLFHRFHKLLLENRAPLIKFTKVALN